MIDYQSYIIGEVPMPKGYRIDKWYNAYNRREFSGNTDDLFEYYFALRFDGQDFQDCIKLKNSTDFRSDIPNYECGNIKAYMQSATNQIGFNQVMVQNKAGEMLLFGKTEESKKEKIWKCDLSTNRITMIEMQLVRFNEKYTDTSIERKEILGLVYTIEKVAGF